ncbi:mannosyltransferase [Elasticomyces elasticus]|nr:mannosyltransferase [Elasticomyces elasticus]KAK4995695.1 mannosyltransferase [Elasticomyces elasticus]
MSIKKARRERVLTARRLNRSEPAPYHLEPIVAFYVFFAAHLLAAIWSPIQDCDEVYNYWEPTHYLTHGYGLQTWEYSPEFALRSWTYAGVHAVVILLGRLIPFASSKVFQFYFLRTMLGFFCAVCEARLFAKMSRTLNPRIGLLFMIIMVTSPGMFHASVSYLPSSFTMYTTMLGIAAFLDWRGGIRTAQGIFWMGTGAILAWPFAAAMVIPFAIEEIMLGSLSGQVFELAHRFTDGTVRSLIVFALQTAIDAFFYQKLLCVPWNMLWYNVLAARDGKGPNIYGTEPWHFYIRNLLLNFNLWFILALVSMPLLLFQHFVRQQSATKQSYLRGIFFLSPFYLWLAIFTLQPHKEERFMYPLYPTLALNAAVALHILLTILGSTDPRSFVRLIPVKLRLAFVSFCVIAAIDLSLWRTVGVVAAYSAPLSVYKPLQSPGVARPGDAGVKAKFVKSEFDGLLPGEFSEAKIGFGFFPGTWLVPPGMNDENSEDVGKYVREL